MTRRDVFRKPLYNTLSEVLSEVLVLVLVLVVLVVLVVLLVLLMLLMLLMLLQVEPPLKSSDQYLCSAMLAFVFALAILAHHEGGACAPVLWIFRP